MAILNKYKDTLDNFINSSDKESLDWLRLIDKRSCNARFEGGLMDYSKKDCRLNSKNVLDILLGLEPKTQDF